MWWRYIEFVIEERTSAVMLLWYGRALLRGSCCEVVLFDAVWCLDGWRANKANRS